MTNKNKSVFSNSLNALQQSVGPLKVFKTSELKELFKKYHKWFDNKRNCSTKQRKEGKEAFELIILHNLKLVIKIAHQYKSSAMEPDDLVNEGTMGLMEAAERFDVDNGAKFSTYASIWIKQRMGRCLSNKSRTIRIPVHTTQKIGKIQDFISTYKSENNNEMPSIDEIKNNVKGISKKILNDLINGGVINLVSVDYILPNEANGASEGCKTLGDIIKDEGITPPDKNGEFLDNTNNLSFFLNKLKGREKFVLKRRFGLGGKKPETLDEIAASYGVTRERIRQEQLAGLRRLRYAMGRKYGENLFIPIEMRIQN